MSLHVAISMVEFVWQIESLLLKTGTKSVGHVYVATSILQKIEKRNRIKRSTVEFTELTY